MGKQAGISANLGACAVSGFASEFDALGRRMVKVADHLKRMTLGRGEGEA
jgi:hypothetical protein